MSEKIGGRRRIYEAGIKTKYCMIAQGICFVIRFYKYETTEQLDAVCHNNNNTNNNNNNRNDSVVKHKAYN